MSPVLRQRLGTFLAVTRRQDLLVLNELVETGAVRPVVDRTYTASPKPPQPSAT
jgi:hypothetical protein